MTPTPEAIAEAAQTLRAGGLVGMPTETVYGLAANALDGKAVARIFEAKGRPSFNPIIIHVADPADAEALVNFSDAARDVATAFWPGPLTIILPRRADCPVSELAGAGLPTLAVRCPSHPVARALIRAAGVPLAAPSANASGTLSPTAPQHVAASLGNAVDIILAGGASSVGLESTVLDLSGDAPAVLRPGAVTAEDISRVLARPVAIDDGAHDKPKSPGQLLRHYAPRAKLRLNARGPDAGEAYLAYGPTMLTRAKIDPSVRNLSPTGDLHEAAANLFAYLHALDEAGYKGIAVAPIPDEGLGIAINDRLRRAAGAQK